jgi:protoporphyrinogen oxidase
MKIAVIGSGISGLSIAKLLSIENEVVLLEKSSNCGGIARTSNINGISYHKTGGHCFNSKYKEVLDFVFNLMPESEWHKIERNAFIKLYNYEINYPIEFSIKQISKYDENLAIKIVRDFLATNDGDIYFNLEDWFRKNFGNTLAEEYFIPYNKKIWNKNPIEMDPLWVKDKLPIPNKSSFFRSLTGNEKDKMPHSEFYYPNSNNQNSLIEKLASGLNILYNFDVKYISKNSINNKWVINKDLEFDLIINTSPLNELPSKIENCPENVLKSANSLEYNKVTTMLWESLPTNKTWTYIPDPNILFHRYIHIGNFFKPIQNVTITEAVGDIPYDEMVRNGKLDSFLIKPLAYHSSDHAYVVFNQNYTNNRETIFKYLNEIGLYTLGRFGEWEYYNMDICIKKSIDLFSIISKEK